MTEICNWKDLVQGTPTNGIWYTKFTEIPFTGTVMGQCQGSLKKGKKVGSWVEYHDNGRLFRKGTYKDGKRYGSWVEYDEDGQKPGKHELSLAEAAGLPKLY